MKQIKLIPLVSSVFLSAFLSVFLSGCHIVWGDPKPCVPEIQTQEKIIYLKPSLPDIQEPPKPLPYDVKFIEYNNITYYQLTLENGEIMILNYERYKSWAETNYEILKKLKDSHG